MKFESSYTVIERFDLKYAVVVTVVVVVVAIVCCCCFAYCLFSLLLLSISFFPMLPLLMLTLLLTLLAGWQLSLSVCLCFSLSVSLSRSASSTPFCAVLSPSTDVLLAHTRAMVCACDRGNRTRQRLTSASAQMYLNRHKFTKTNDNSTSDGASHPYEYTPGVWCQWLLHRHLITISLDNPK